MERLIEPLQTAEFKITTENANMRLDKFIVQQYPAYSRTFLQELIHNEHIAINGKIVNKSSIILKTNDLVTITFPEISKPEKKIHATDFGVEILYKGDHFLVVNKPAGLLVHETETKSDEPTLVDWIISNFEEIRHVGIIDRPGIVHRLDKDTSGIIIIPRTNYAHAQFGDMFKNKTIQKTYLAVVEGHPPIEGTVNLPIGRHPVLRHKMATFTPADVSRSSSIREAVTHYKVLEYFNDAALIEAKPVTGRTHQIRVHMASLGHPLLGDQTYGKKSKLIKRHALHAYKIEFEFDGKPYSFVCEPPDDFNMLLKTIK